MRQEYTYNDWLEDRQYFDPDDPILTSNVEVGLSEHMSLQQYNSGIRNSPEWLFKQEKVVSESDYQQIISAKKEAFKIILNAIILDIPKHLGKLLQNEPDKEHILKNKLVLIDKYFENNDKIKEQIDYIESNYPPFPISGGEYQDLKRNNNISHFKYRLYSKSTIHEPTILPPVSLKKPKGFLLTAVLQEERRHIKIMLNQRELTPELILDKFNDIKIIKGESKAFDEIYEWLTVSMGYTMDQIESEFNWKFNFEAIRKRNQRYQDKKKQ